MFWNVKQIYRKTLMPKCDFTLWHGCSLVNLLHRTPFLKSISGWLLLRNEFLKFSFTCRILILLFDMQSFFDFVSNTATIAKATYYYNDLNFDEINCYKLNWMHHFNISIFLFWRGRKNLVEYFVVCSISHWFW